MRVQNHGAFPPANTPNRLQIEANRNRFTICNCLLHALKEMLLQSGATLVAAATTPAQTKWSQLQQQQCKQRIAHLTKSQHTEPAADGGMLLDGVAKDEDKTSKATQQ
jgi:hypothetical protein